MKQNWRNLTDRALFFLSEGSIWTSVHFILTGAWIAVAPAMVVFHWWESVEFVAIISVYANIVGHWSAWQAARAEESAEERESR